MVSVVEDGIFLPEFDEPVAAFVFQVPVITRIRPVAPFIDVAVLHGIVVDVVQRGEVMTLAPHYSVTAAKPDLATLFVVFFVDLERCAPVKLPLGFGERFYVGDFDEDVIVIGKHDPRCDFE